MVLDASAKTLDNISPRIYKRQAGSIREAECAGILDRPIRIILER
jgi:hypothetical protein